MANLGSAGIAFCVAVLVLGACVNSTPVDFKDSQQSRMLLQKTSPAPAPSSNYCSLPNGQVIDAPAVNSTATQQGLFGDIGHAVGCWLDGYFHTGSCKGRRLLATSVPPCCPSYTVQNGDTVQSIISTQNLPSNAGDQLTGLNNITGTTLTPGSSLTLPCARLLQWEQLQASAPAPVKSGSTALG